MLFPRRKQNHESHNRNRAQNHKVCVEPLGTVAEETLKTRERVVPLKTVTPLDVQKLIPRILKRFVEGVRISLRLFVVVILVCGATFACE
jgi:hypothetical protein